MADNYTIQDPVFRINRTATLAVTTTWQAIDFNGTSTANRNTFGIDQVSGNRMVYWDSTNTLFTLGTCNLTNCAIQIQ